MNPFDPFNLFHLRGYGTMRNVTLALPTGVVRNMLPDGLELGPQRMTPDGTHPVVMGFHDMFDLRPSVPSLLPSMTYHEHSVGIPYCYVVRNGPWPAIGSPGPYYYMPVLFLDDPLAALGGIVFWGYNKKLVTYRVSSDGMTIVGPDGQPVLSVTYEPAGDAKPVEAYPLFDLQRAAVSQLLISRVPAAVGPFFVVAGFPKQWEVAAVRPLRAVIDIHAEYVVGFAPGRYPATARTAGIDASVMGAYELCAPFQVGSPYPPLPGWS